MTNQGTQESGAAMINSAPNEQRLRELRRSYWWLPASFCVPCLMLFLGSHEPTWTQRAIEALRGASASTLVAIVIFALGRLDQRLGNRPGSDKKIEFVTVILGIMLWFVWFGATQIMFRASDEIKPLSADDPHF